MYGRLPVCIRRWRAKLEDFQTVSNRTTQLGRNAHVRKGLATVFMVADMGLFAGVSPRVDR